MRISEKNYQKLVSDPEHAEKIREGQHLVHGLLSRSATDMQFRRRLLENPKGTVIAFYEETYGEPLAEDQWPLEVQFIENEGDVTYVLPDPIDDEIELSEAELDSVGGGVSPALLTAGFLVGAGGSLGIYVGGKAIEEAYEDDVACTS